MSINPAAHDPTRRTVALLNGITVCRSMVFLVPVIVPFFAGHIGLGFQDFLASEAIFALVMVSFEVPSGWLADVGRRKWVLVLGGVLSAAGVPLFIPAGDFAGAALAQGLMGVGISLFSGADSALLYDALRQHGQEGRYRAVESRRHGFGLYAVALSSLIGAGLYAIDPVLPVLGMVGGYLVAAACALALDEPERQRQPTSWRRPALRALPSANRVVIAAILTGAVLFAGTSVAMWAQQPYYSALHIGTEWFGLLMALGFISGGLAGHFGHFLDRWFGAAASLSAIWLVLVVAFAVAGLWPGHGGVALLLCGSAAWGVGWPVLQTIINQHVGAARRATLLSVAAAAVKLAFMPLSAVVGWLANGQGIAFAVLGLAGILLTLGGPVLLWLRREMGGDPMPRMSITARDG